MSPLKLSTLTSLRKLSERNYLRKFSAQVPLGALSARVPVQVLCSRASFSAQGRQSGAGVLASSITPIHAKGQIIGLLGFGTSTMPGREVCASSKIGKNRSFCPATAPIRSQSRRETSSSILLGKCLGFASSSSVNSGLVGSTFNIQFDMIILIRKLERFIVRELVPINGNLLPTFITSVL